MKKEEVNLLTLKKYHKILSKLTGKIYIDKNAKCYLFESDYEAEQFCSQLEETFYDEAQCYKAVPFVSYCFGLGIQAIKIKPAASDDYTEIPITKQDARHQFYNEKTNYNILRLKQTKKSKYLKELPNSLLIAPILIDRREMGQYPVIHYAYAIVPQSGTYYIAFTGMQEYQKWAETQNIPFSPSQTSLQEMNKIREENPILINPMSDQLVLTHKQILSITKKEQQ